MKKMQLFVAGAVMLFAAACSQAGSNKSAAPTENGAAPMAASLGSDSIPGAARSINRSTAENLISEWYKDNSCLPTDSAGDTIVSYFIDRRSLLSLLTKESSDGIRLYLAKSPVHGGMTMILCPTVPKSTDPKVHNNDLSLIYEYISFCPTTCNQDPAVELYIKR
jgi:hypothetical protein